MSNIFITDVIGTGTYAVPTQDSELASATSGFDGLLSTVANLAYDRVLAWVEDAGGPGGAEGNRTLNCLVEKFTYLSKECPSETEVDTMTAAIEAALEADANITSIGEQQCHLFQAGAYFLWNRDSSGFLYPNVATDDVAVGPFASPNGKWFDDGDLVVGGNTMAGSEVLRVNGTALIDQDGNAIGLDVDSEATDSPLINLQPIVTNDRGDVAFGTVRTADPASPDEGDLWYNSTDDVMRFYDGSAVQDWPVDVQQATATADTTITATTDTLINSMTITPGAGNYLVIFTASAATSGLFVEFYYSIYVGGVQVAHTERETETNFEDAFATHAWVTSVGATDAIEVRGRNSAPAQTATIHERTLTVVRLSR